MTRLYRCAHLHILEEYKNSIWENTKICVTIWQKEKCMRACDVEAKLKFNLEMRMRARALTFKLPINIVRCHRDKYLVTVYCAATRFGLCAIFATLCACIYIKVSCAFLFTHTWKSASRVKSFLHFNFVCMLATMQKSKQCIFITHTTYTYCAAQILLRFFQWYLK